jgi:hypothetical protein
MTKQTKPNSHQLNLRLCTETAMNLPQQQRTELAAALADMLLKAALAPETKIPAEAGDEPEAHD